jgi:hypothetical protein
MCIGKGDSRAYTAKVIGDIVKKGVREAKIESYLRLAKSTINATLQHQSDQQMENRKKKWAILVSDGYTVHDPQVDLKLIYDQCAKRLTGYKGLKVESEVHYQLNVLYFDRSRIFLLVKI